MGGRCLRSCGTPLFAMTISIALSRIGEELQCAWKLRSSVRTYRGCVDGRHGEWSCYRIVGLGCGSLG